MLEKVRSSRDKVIDRPEMIASKLPLVHRVVDNRGIS